MAPASAPLVAQLRQLIYYHLDHNLLKNALFLAQRLVAYEQRSPEAAYLLAFCQLQSGYTKASWDTSRPFALKGSHLGCCYVFALASLDLGRNVDGIHALDKSRQLWSNRNTWNQHSEFRRQHIPDAAAVLCLKGKLYKNHKNVEEAVQCWVAALKLNPFMWDAYSALADSGAKINVANIYKLNPDLVNMIHASYACNKENIQPTADKSNLPLQAQTTNHQVADPFVSTQQKSPSHSVLFEKFNNSKVNSNTVHPVLDEECLDTPSTVVDPDDSMMQTNGNSRWEAPSAPIRKTKSIQDVPLEASSRLKSASTKAKARLKPVSDEIGASHEPPPPGPPSKRTISGQVPSTASTVASNTSGPARRSTRLQTSRPPSANALGKPPSFANSLGLREGTRDIKKAKAPVPKPRAATTATVGRVVSGNRAKFGPTNEGSDAELKEHRATAVPPVPVLANPKVRAPSATAAEKDIEALSALLDLLCQIAKGNSAMSHFDCSRAIQYFNALPAAHRETPYILAKLAQCYHEQAQYAEAEKYFIHVRQVAPSQLDGMELYSTTLWHLKSEIELSYLAHELSDIERNSPQAWVAIGNSFSLQRDHEQALKCFRRSTQLDSSFAYGFTLQGHEYVANEEFEKALEAYRAAIAADSRHYNAWYGLGKVYERLGKWQVAETHYRTARTINPSNAVLTCCIGVVLEKLRRPADALEFYSEACKLAPRSALSRFKKARCLMALGQPADALEELNILKDLAPEEANVWFLMGRLYKMVGERGRAVKAFTIALNLDPKAAQFIKDAMESLDDDEDVGADDDEDMD